MNKLMKNAGLLDCQLAPNVVTVVPNWKNSTKFKKPIPQLVFPGNMEVPGSFLVGSVLPYVEKVPL